MSNKEIIGSKSIIEVFNKHVIILTDNRIILTNNKTDKITYKIIENVKSCSEMGWEPKLGLLVFC
jgi:hypothetical protein